MNRYSAGGIWRWSNWQKITERHYRNTTEVILGVTKAYFAFNKLWKIVIVIVLRKFKENISIYIDILSHILCKISVIIHFIENISGSWRNQLIKSGFLIILNMTFYNIMHTSQVCNIIKPNRLSLLKFGLFGITWYTIMYLFFHNRGLLGRF